MIQVVVKRDGRVVGYNEEKIKAAIRKAMLTTELGEDEALIQKIADRIGARGAERMTVEEIQDMVELELMSSPRKPVRKWPSVISHTATNAALHAARKPATCFWKLSRRKATTSPARTRT